MDFHGMKSEDVLAHFRVSKDKGLSAAEAEKRRAEYGPNVISGKHKRGIFEILVSQFENFLLILLILAAGVSFFIGHMLDAIGIAVAIVLTVVFGFILEYKADESMRALQALQAPKATILSNGKTQVIDATQLVPGDIIYVEEGEKIAADCRIISVANFEVNESALTGESIAVVKNFGVGDVNSPISERANMVYAGTLAVRGHASAVVVATGDQTELGKIAAKLSEIESEETTLQKSLDDLGKKVSILSIMVILAFFVIGVIQEKEITELFVLGISLVVAAVPEGLLTVLTIILAIGVKRMADNNALVRKLSAVETLGGASVIVSDKTGTITQGKMAVTKIFYAGTEYVAAELPEKSKVLEFAAYCNSAKITKSGFVGDEMDKAILHAAEARGIDIHKLKKDKPLAFHPLDSVRKRMSAVFDINGKKVAIVKGAPEIMLKLCRDAETHNGPKKMDEVRHAEIEGALGKMANEGMRVLAIAYKKVDAKKAKMLVKTDGEIERGLTFLGLLAFSDPPRPEAYETLRAADRAGIRVIMLTGDNVKTAVAIGKEIGLIEEENDAVEWSAIERLDDEKLKETLGSIRIIARATPLSKLRIVELLIEMGETVVVTGDGVNDALALKKAQVGVVMGSGTDVSKEAGNLVLLDDNIATLVAAIKYGRTIFNNIINFIRFQFTTNVAMLALFFISFFGGIPYLLTPIQILFTNIVMDGPPALALGLEKSIRDVLDEKPRKGRGLISRNLSLSIFLSAFFMAIVTLAVFLYFSSHAPAIALTATFLVFVLMQLFNALNCRFSKDRFFHEPWANKWLFISLALVFGILVATIDVPILQEIFSTKHLPLSAWILVTLSAASILVFEEIKKAFMQQITDY